ncbi:MULTISPECIES: EpsI family protein [Akkermansia]|nr:MULTISPECIES: EpsI family protein [Akkermansia]
MNIKTLKILIIPFLMAVMLGGTYLMPRKGEVQDSSISMDLPTGMNPYGWHGTRRQESEQERSLLAPDTEFSKADYVQELPISLDETETVPVLCRVSIVRSGHDLNNSIHRPERCLPAQGHFNLTGTTADVPVEGHGTIRMTKLKSQQNIAPDHPQPVILDSMHYYVFIGHRHMTEDHLIRTLMDMKDRVLHGMDQRWCYFQISTTYGDKIRVSEEKAREQTERLISQLLSQLVKWDELKR